MKGESYKSVFSISGFRFYFAFKFCVMMVNNMLAIACGQYIYEVTKDPLMLGYAGLCFFVPKFLLTLPAGHFADALPKLKIMKVCRSVILCLIAVTLLLFDLKSISVAHLYVFLVLVASFHSFDAPGSQALVPMLVPESLFTKAVTWVSASIHGGIVAGPLLAGVLYAAYGLQGVFIAVLVFSLMNVVAVFRIQLMTNEKLGTGKFDFKNILAGARYIFANKILLGAISMDLFAVLFGGAIALLPVFANDILKVGPEGLGVLRAAQSVGAGLMAFALARISSFRNTGKWLFVCVFLFGLGTVGFALSKNFYLSLFFLIFIGAVDMVSVVVRGVMVQINTPDEMRGRVSAVNMIFIGASNELGEFESGLTARLFGTVPAAVLGGVLTMSVVTLWSFLFRELRDLKVLGKATVNEK